MKNLFLLFTALTLFFAANSAHAQAERLPKALETKVIALIENMSPDAWNEANTDASFDFVLFDKREKRVIIGYRTRELDTRKPFVKQHSIVVEGISSLNEIIETAPNGYRSLNDKIATEILETI